MAKSKRRHRVNPRRRHCRINRRRNPMSGITRSVGAAFTKQHLMDAAIWGGSAIGINMLRNYIVGMLPASITSGKLVGPLVTHGVGLALCGASLAVPKVGNKVFVGGLMGEGVTILGDVLSMAGVTAKLGEFASTSSLQMGEFANTRSLGMGEFATSESLPEGVFMDDQLSATSDATQNV